MLFDPGSPRRATTAAQFRIATKRFQRIGEEAAFARRHEKSCFLVHHRLRNTGKDGRDNGARRRHRFEDDGWENVAGALLIGRRSERENVAVAQFFEPATLGKRARERDHPTQAQPGNLLLKIPGSGPSPMISQRNWMLRWRNC